MKYSKVQLDIWRAREKLDRQLAGMTTEQLVEHSESVIRRFKEQTGIDLPIAQPRSEVAEREIQ